MFLSSGVTLGQKVDKANLDNAARRTSKATKVLTELSALPAAESIPRTLIDRAKAIAVFPDTSKVNALFQKAIKGYGLISRRLSDGWGTPGFYGFGVMDQGWTRIKSDNPGIIMLFMDEATVKAFEKDNIPLSGTAGPVGEVTDEDQRKLSNVSIIVYSLSDGKLRGFEIDDDSSSQAGIGSDNNINRAVYGLKARDVFWGKSPVGPPLPPEISEFQNALLRFSNP